jgi:hypothetical protein
MSEATSLLIEARVDERERPAMEEARAQLQEYLVRAGAAQARVELVFAAADAPVAAASGTLVVASLMTELSRGEEPLESTTRRWLAHLGDLASQGTPVYLCNVFRHAAERARDGRPTPLLDRIRRLDLMAIQLSRDTGAGVIDIDRAFAEIGARALGCDWRLQGALAARVAGHTAARCFLSHGLEAWLDAGLQERALAASASLRDLHRRLLREGAIR